MVIDVVDWASSENDKNILPIYSQDVKNQDIQFELDIYPNPATDKINVLLPSTTTLPVEVEIYDVMGKKVGTHTATKKSFFLEINSLEKGIYFIKANTTDYNITKKLIVK